MGWWIHTTTSAKHVPTNRSNLFMSGYWNRTGCLFFKSLPYCLKELFFHVPLIVNLISCIEHWNMSYFLPIRNHVGFALCPHSLTSQSVWEFYLAQIAIKTLWQNYTLVIPLSGICKKKKYGRNLQNYTLEIPLSGICKICYLGGIYYSGWCVHGEMSFVCVVLRIVWYCFWIQTMLLAHLIEIISLTFHPLTVSTNISLPTTRSCFRL
jgi:hypothetical protein